MKLDYYDYPMQLICLFATNKVFKNEKQQIEV